MFFSRISAGATGKFPESDKNCAKTSFRGPTTWNDVRGNALKGTGKQTNEQIYKVFTPYVDDHQSQEQELETVDSLVGKQRGTSSHKMDEPVTHDKQQCHVEHCRSGLFQDSDFAQDPQNFKSNSGGILCIFESRTFVPIVGCARNKLQIHTVLLNLRLHRQMQAFAWTVFPVLISGKGLMKHYIRLLYRQHLTVRTACAHSSRCVSHFIQCTCIVRDGFRVDPPLCPGTS